MPDSATAPQKLVVEYRHITGTSDLEVAIHVPLSDSTHRYEVEKLSIFFGTFKTILISPYVVPKEKATDIHHSMWSTTMTNNSFLRIGCYDNSAVGCHSVIYQADPVKLVRIHHFGWPENELPVLRKLERSRIVSPN